MLRRALVGTGILTALLLALACGSSDPPPTSPLDDRDSAIATQMPTQATATPTTPSAAPSLSATPGTDPVVEEAIARLAEWLDAPEAEFAFTSIEAVDWPDACLGIENPAVLCANVVTPGYQVMLHHLAAPNTLYVVHASEDGRYAWAPSRKLTPRIVASVDASAGTLALEPLGTSEDHMGTEQRVAPGSTLEVGLADLAPGDRVLIGTADPLNGEPAGLIVLLAPFEG